MKSSYQSMQWVACGLAAFLFGGAPALAQNNPESGDEPGVQGQVGGQVGGTWQPPTGEATGTPMAPSAASSEIAVDSGSNSASGDDHADVVGTFGIGFFGTQTLPLMGCDLGAALCAPIADNLSAPTIGLRYWLSEMLGVEGALGLNISSGTNGPVDTSQFGFALHGGVPVALAHSGHFVFEVVPQLNFGVTSGSFETTGPAAVTTDTSGLLFEIGAKAGAEIHFGFIGIPQLSLQGTIGLMVRHESRDAETTAGAAPVVKSEQSQTTIGTGIDGEPWDIFTGSITAIYYL